MTKPFKPLDEVQLAPSFGDETLYIVADTPDSDGHLHLFPKGHLKKAHVNNLMHFNPRVETRYRVPLRVGDTVEHYDRKSYYGLRLPNWEGKVVDIDPSKLPLVGVDFGGEFIRWIPAVDLIHTP
jgi:hypothetical protein